jgi:hypothetical protein
MVEVDGWEIEVADGSPIVVARGGTDEDHDEAFKNGLIHAQKGLDLTCFRVANNLLIKSYEDENITWWTSQNTTVLRITSFAPMGLAVGSIIATVREDSDCIVPQPTPQTSKWDESYRYFRLSQTTDDLFHAFWNAYLALEAVLSSITSPNISPSGSIAEAEDAWFWRALTESSLLVNLKSVVPNETTDPVDYLYNLYVNSRSAMSHAKSGRVVLLPQSDNERSTVLVSLKTLAALYLLLAEHKLGLRRLGDAMTPGEFRAMFLPTLDQMEAFASDDRAAFGAADLVANPSGGSLVPLTAITSAIVESPFLIKRLWSAPVGNFTDLPHIRRVVGMNNQRPTMAEVLQADLKLGCVDQLQVALGVRGLNHQQPRDRYSF